MLSLHSSTLTFSNVLYFLPEMCPKGLDPMLEGLVNVTSSYCSGRGLCNFNTGACSCFTGFSNSNCDVYLTTDPAASALPITDIMVLAATNSSFDQSYLHLHATYPVVTDTFNWITTSDSVESNFILDAFGNINIVNGAINFGGGITVGNGGVKVRNSATINSGGLSVTGGLSLSSNALFINGGLSTTGGLTIANDLFGSYAGLAVKGGITVNTLGMSITNGGIKKIIGGATIRTGGLAVTGGVSVGAGGVYLNKKGKLIINSGGLYITGGVTINNGLLPSPTFSVSLSVTDGVSIADSGEG